MKQWNRLLRDAAEGQFWALAAQQTDRLPADLLEILSCKYGRTLNIPCEESNATLLDSLSVMLENPAVDLVQRRYGRINLNEI